MEGPSGPSLRHLRVFQMVAQLESVRKAADSVHLSQPAVTQAIGKLEEQVGATLFERRSSGTYLSAAGKIFVSRIGSMFRQIEDALEAFGLPSTKDKTLTSVAGRITRSQIRALAAIADGRSFAAAARKIGISQASLHRPARELERNFGKTLFHHSIHGVVTTRAGAELARRLTLAMRELDWGIEEVQTAKGLFGGRLTVGAMPLAGSFLLAPVLNELTRLWPQTQVQVLNGDVNHLSKSLHLGEVDFVVGLVRNRPESEEFVQEPLVSSAYVIVARKNHPLTEKRKIRAADLESYDWIAPGKGATRRVAFDQLMNSMRRRPNANIETYSLSTIRLLLSESNRLALLTRFEYEFEKTAGALVTLPFEAIGPIHSIGIAMRANWTPTPLHLKFMELIRSHSATLRGGVVGHNQAA